MSLQSEAYNSWTKAEKEGSLFIQQSDQNAQIGIPIPTKSASFGQPLPGEEGIYKPVNLQGVDPYTFGAFALPAGGFGQVKTTLSTASTKLSSILNVLRKGKKELNTVLWAAAALTILYDFLAGKKDDKQLTHSEIMNSLKYGIIDEAEAQKQIKAIPGVTSQEIELFNAEAHKILTDAAIEEKALQAGLDLAAKYGITPVGGESQQDIANIATSKARSEQNAALAAAAQPDLGPFPELGSQNLPPDVLAEAQRMIFDFQKHPEDYSADASLKVNQLKESLTRPVGVPLKNVSLAPASKKSKSPQSSAATAAGGASGSSSSTNMSSTKAPTPGEQYVASGQGLTWNPFTKKWIKVK